METTIKKAYFKNNPQSTMFYDADESGLKLTNSNIGVLENYNPAIHQIVARAISIGRIIQVTKAEYKSFIASLNEEATEENDTEETEEETTGEEETEVEETEVEETVSPLEALTSKEELMTWAEDQSFISEKDLDEAKKLKKAKELRKFLQELLDLEGK